MLPKMLFQSQQPSLSSSTHVYLRMHNLYCDVMLPDDCCREKLRTYEIMGTQDQHACVGLAQARPNYDMNFFFKISSAQLSY